MPFNGSGTFSRLYSWVTDAANNINISSSRTDAEMNGFAAALTNCVTRDGQSPPSADLPMGGKKLTNLGAATVGTDALSQAAGDARYAGLASPAFTGTPTAPTATGGTNTTQIATTAYVIAALVAYAPFASPTFTGTVTVPTPTTADSTTKAASTAYVQANLASYALTSALAAYAPLASPVLTGSPVAPTQAVGDSSTKLATTAFVQTGKVAQVQSVATAATVTPTFANDMVRITALAAACQLLNWTGTAQDGWGIVVRIKDNGTARALTYDTKYRAVGVIAPTTTVINKTLYLGYIYNLADDKFDLVSVAQE